MLLLYYKFINYKILFIIATSCKDLRPKEARPLEQVSFKFTYIVI